MMTTVSQIKAGSQIFEASEMLLLFLIDSIAVINAPLAKLKYLNLSSFFVFFEKNAFKATTGLSVDDVCINIKIFPNNITKIIN